MEAQETSKSAKIAYEKFSAEAASHAKEVERLEALKEEKFIGRTVSLAMSIRDQVFEFEPPYDCGNPYEMWRSWLIGKYPDEDNDQYG